MNDDDLLILPRGPTLFFRTFISCRFTKGRGRMEEPRIDLPLSEARGLGPGGVDAMMT